VQGEELVHAAIVARQRVARISTLARMTSLNTRDGVPLHLREWPLAAARGTVLLAHGLGEHVGRYEHVAAHLNRAGWRAVGYDHRGHGHSGGARGRLTHADDLLRDLSTVIDAVRAQAGGPVVLLGHSMGGAVASRFVAEGLAAAPAAWYRSADALVLSSPALAADLSAVQKTMMTVFGALAPDFVVGNGLPLEALCRDPAVVRAYKADALVHDRVSPKLARFILEAGTHVRAQAARWRTPTLLLWAGSDRCVAPRGSAEFAAAAPGAVVTSRCFEPMYHEIFNDPQRDEVLAALTSWLGSSLAR
jgi:alpha-beta hydrolase superfamily lysophospholipase